MPTIWNSGFENRLDSAALMSDSESSGNSSAISMTRPALKPMSLPMDSLALDLSPAMRVRPCLSERSSPVLRRIMPEAETSSPGMFSSPPTTMQAACQYSSTVPQMRCRESLREVEVRRTLVFVGEAKKLTMPQMAAVSVLVEEAQPAIAKNLWPQRWWTMRSPQGLRSKSLGERPGPQKKETMFQKCSALVSRLAEKAANSTWMSVRGVPSGLGAHSIPYFSRYPRERYSCICGGSCIVRREKA